MNTSTASLTGVVVERRTDKLMAEGSIPGTEKLFSGPEKMFPEK